MTDSAVSEATLRSQLRLLSRSQWYILLILTGILISYGLTFTQRRQLLCALRGESTAEENPRVLRVFSNLLILSALLFFDRIAEQTAQTSADSPQKEASNQVNRIASGLVLAASILRLWDVLCLRSPVIHRGSDSCIDCDSLLE